jgi:hypothetical protein
LYEAGLFLKETAPAPIAMGIPNRTVETDAMSDEASVAIAVRAIPPDTVAPASKAFSSEGGALEMLTLAPVAMPIPGPVMWELNIAATEASMFTFQYGRQPHQEQVHPKTFVR